MSRKVQLKSQSPVLWPLLAVNGGTQYSLALETACGRIAQALLGNVGGRLRVRRLADFRADNGIGAQVTCQSESPSHLAGSGLRFCLLVIAGVSR